MELKQEAEPRAEHWRRWVDQRIAGLACAIVGAASLAAMLIRSAITGELAMLPPLIFTIPPVVVAAGLAVTAAVRRERSWRLPFAGVAAAGAAIAAGWVAIAAAILAGVIFLFWLVGELAG